MEMISKSSDLLTRLRSVTLEDELKLSDFWPAENSMAQVTQSPFSSDLYSGRVAAIPSIWDESEPVPTVRKSEEPKIQSEILLQNPPKIQAETKPEVTTLAARPVVEEMPVEKTHEPYTLENRDNPFAQISRNSPKPSWEALRNLNGWLASLSCFGILGFLCGSSLTAWSTLSGSGTHSLTSIGLSLTISGLLMFILVGFYQTIRTVSERT